MVVSDALIESKANKHTPGILWTRDVCFCKDCDALLTYLTVEKVSKLGSPLQHSISGLYNTQCSH